MTAASPASPMLFAVLMILGVGQGSLATAGTVFPQAAATGAPVPHPAGGSFTAEYTGIAHGLAVLKLSAGLTMTPTSYAAHVTFHTAGLVGMIVHADNDSSAAGDFVGEQVVPRMFAGSGHLRGTARATRIDYQGGNPVIRTLTPPVEQERTPVDPASTVHTIDTLSAVALLVREIAEHGRCDGAVTTFDGRRLATQTAHFAGREVLEKTSRSSYSGPALRCDFEGRQLGGFVKTEDEDDLKKPRRGTAWLADVVPGAPPIPVRINFDNKLLGQVTLYLTAAAGSGVPVSAVCCGDIHAQAR